MKIEFADKHLALILTDQAHMLGLPIGVIKSARDKLHALKSASSELTLRSMRSWDYKKIDEDVKQIRLNDQYRIRFKLDASTLPPTITVTFIGDPH